MKILLAVLIFLSYTVLSKEYHIMKHYKITSDILGNFDSDETLLTCSGKIIDVQTDNNDYIYFKHISKDLSTVKLIFFNTEIYTEKDKIYKMMVTCDTF